MGVKDAVGDVIVGIGDVTCGALKCGLLAKIQIAA
jgi:hypothetical protein